MSAKSLLGAVRAAAFVVPVVGVLLACTCTGPGGADINCNGNGSNVDCDVTHTHGTAPLKVCWDMEASCTNGVTGHIDNVCQVVNPGETATRSVPLSSFSGLSGCDKVTGLTLSNQSADPT